MTTKFSKNIIILMSGTSFAQAIPIAFTPILTRLYTPKDFGVFALFYSISMILGTVINLRYEQAIILPKKNEDSIYICILSFLINIIFSILLLIIIFFFNNEICVLLGNKEISNWLYFLPITISLIGTFNILNYYNTRIEKFKDISKAIIFKSLSLTIVQTIMGLFKFGFSGLITGYFISLFTSNMKLFINFKNGFSLKKIRKAKLVFLLSRYKRFPFFSFWSALLNSSSIHLTNILISSFYSLTSLGYYNILQRVLGIPFSVIGTSFSQVFLQTSTREKQLKGNSINIFKKTLFKLFIIALPIFVFLYFISDYLFLLFLGEDWSILGSYAKLLIPMFFIKFISSALSTTLVVYEKQSEELFINIIIFSSSILLFFIFDEFEDYLSFLSIFLSFNYFCFIIYYYHLSKGLCEKFN